MGPERAVGVAADNPLGRHGPHIEGRVGGDIAAVGEGEFRHGVALLLGAANHGGGLGTAEAGVGIEIQFPVLAGIAVDDPLGIQRPDGGLRVSRKA